MKTQIFPTLFGCIMVLLIACNPKSAQPEPVVVDKDQIKKEIQAKENEFADVYNGGVVKDIGYYAEDAIIFYQNEKPLRGRKTIIDYFAENLETNTNKVSFTTIEVFACNDGSQVVELGYFTVADSTGTAINTGHYMSLFEKRDGKYVCVRDMSASDLPIGEN